MENNAKRTTHHSHVECPLFDLDQDFRGSQTKHRYSISEFPLDCKERPIDIKFAYYTLNLVGIQIHIVKSSLTTTTAYNTFPQDKQTTSK